MYLTWMVEGVQANSTQKKPCLAHNLSISKLILHQNNDLEPHLSNDYDISIELGNIMLIML